MEIKKSSKADLDNRRFQGFLIGAIMVLATLFVALEYQWDAADGADYEKLDDIVKELDLAALKAEEERIPLLKQPAKEVPQSAEKIEEVPTEQEPEQAELDQQATAEEQELPVAEDEKPEKAQDIEQRTPDYKTVEQLPEFPGGASELMKWLTKNLKYPKQAQQQKRQGRVVAQFIVNADGSLSDFEIVRSVHPELDSEAMRVLKLMPPWKAGQQDKKPCRTVVCIPIVFKL